MSQALRARVCGSGPDLALIHGWGLPGGVWEPVLDALSAQFRVHLLDLPGYDGAPAKPGATELNSLADALLATLPPRVNLCGWSLGAHLAIHAAHRHPQRVERLILVGASPVFVRQPDWRHGVPPHLLDDFESLLESNPALLLSRFAKMINQGDHAARTLARSASALVGNTLPDITALTTGLHLLRDTDWRPLAAQIRQPVLLIHGDADPLMPLAGAQAMHGLFAAAPLATLDVFTGSAHMPFLSQPERFLTVLTGFVANRQP